MRKLTAQLSVIAWICLVSILFGALSPIGSHSTVLVGPPADEVEVCTAQGMVTLLVKKTGSDTSDPMPRGVVKRCPWCAIHGSAPGLLPVHGFAFPIIRQGAPYPQLFCRSAASLFTWFKANPRAPPAQT